MGRGSAAEVCAMPLAKACFCPFRVRMRGFHDLLREKPSSLFMLLGWNSIYIASLMIWSIHLDFLARIPPARLHSITTQKITNDKIYIILELFIQKPCLRMYFLHNQLVAILIFGSVISMD
jgi:hypothetical protein